MRWCNFKWDPTFYLLDMKSFECSSPSELDKKFFGEQSLLSALSLEQLSTSRVSNDTMAEGSDSRLSILASLCLSSDPSSPSQAFPMNNLNTQETDNCHLAVPSHRQSSTPHMLLQKPKKAACFDQSYSDLTAPQMSWDVSLIKAENGSIPCMESSALESTWSPKPQSTQHSPAEVSPWHGLECPSKHNLNIEKIQRFERKKCKVFSCAWLCLHRWIKVDFKHWMYMWR